MPIPLIPIISGLASLAPSVGRLIAGDKGENAAQAVANIARSVTGENDVQEQLSRDNQKAKNRKEDREVQWYFSGVS